MTNAGTPRLAVLVSGGGRTLANLLERITIGSLRATVATVVSSRDGVRGIDVARAGGIAAHVLSPAGRPSEAWAADVFAVCREAGADLVVMAGFLHLLPIAADFADRVINIHPSLLPAFGGRGFHGMHVHRAVLARGCTISGCTVHLVDDAYDHGRIVHQVAVPVLPDDTPESLAARVFAAECEALPAAVSRLTLPLDGKEDRWDDRSDT